MNTAENTYTIALYDGMEARIVTAPAAQGFWAYGILFDGNAAVISETGNRLHLAMCHADGAAVAIEALLTRAGCPERDWKGCTVDALASAGMECTCDDESPCRDCGASTDDGEGWDGYCGNCADRRTCPGCFDEKEPEAATCGDAGCAA